MADQETIPDYTGSDTIVLVVSLPDSYPTALLPDDQIEIVLEEGGNDLDVNWEAAVTEPTDAWFESDVGDHAIAVRIDTSSLDTRRSTSLEVAVETPAPTEVVKQAYVDGVLSDAELEVRLDETMSLNEESAPTVQMPMTVDQEAGDA